MCKTHASSLIVMAFFTTVIVTIMVTVSVTTIVTGYSHCHIVTILFQLICIGCHQCCSCSTKVDRLQVVEENIHHNIHLDFTSLPPFPYSLPNIFTFETTSNSCRVRQKCIWHNDVADASSHSDCSIALTEPYIPCLPNVQNVPWNVSNHAYLRLATLHSASSIFSLNLPTHLM